MIRFAQQTSDVTAKAPKITSAPTPIVLQAPEIEVTPVVTEVVDGAMLITDLPNVSGPSPAKSLKTRAARKPKASPEAVVAQLALDA